MSARGSAGRRAAGLLPFPILRCCIGGMVRMSCLHGLLDVVPSLTVQGLRRPGRPPGHGRSEPVRAGSVLLAGSDVLPVGVWAASVPISSGAVTALLWAGGS
jgi:hypothetical protein